MVTFKLFLITLGLLCITNAQPFPSDFNRGVPSSTTPPTCRRALSECLKRLDKRESCKTLPVPERSRLPFVPPGDFLLQRLRRNVWFLYDGNYNSLIIVTPHRLMLIDFLVTFNGTSDDPRTKPERAVEQIIGDVVPRGGNFVPKRIDMIYSHAHFDHIGSARGFYEYAKQRFPKAKFVIWGTKETSDLIKASSTNRAVLPNAIITKRGRTLRVRKDLEIRMSILGGHTQQDLMLFIPRFKKQPSILFAVDMVFPKWVMPFNLAITQDVRALVNSNKAILEMDFDMFLGGHLHIGDKNDVRVNLEYLQDLLRITEEAPPSVSRRSLDEAGLMNINDRTQREFGNLWWIIRLVREVEIDVCYRRMIEKWGCRLAAVDIHLRGHCLIGLMFHSTDA